MESENKIIVGAGGEKALTNNLFIAKNNGNNNNCYDYDKY